MGRQVVDIRGRRFHMLTVVKRSESKGRQNQVLWDCLCECGGHITLSSSNLGSGNTKSCGCLPRGRRSDKPRKWVNSVNRYGPSRTTHPLYEVLHGMRNRCKPDGEYGKIGIMMCDEWRSPSTGFQQFMTDMAPTWVNGLTIERIDNSIGYTPSNCRWVRKPVQMMNRTCNRDIEVTFRDGAKQIVVGGHISEFCRGQGFDIRKMVDVLSGRLPHYRGITAVYLPFKIPAWLRPFGS